jgi:N-carbamoylputrescine amidase
MKTVCVAATQMRCTDDQDRNIARAEELVREAASKGADIILVQELFQWLYFCQVEKPEFFYLAASMEDSRAVGHFSALARELSVVLPVSFFEKRNQARYNAIAVIDADGTNLGIYRKTHIPDGPGYEEKFYFNPGDTGFKVWHTKYADIGIGICWDQWFPETARALVLGGADILFFPTAIGSEPGNPDYDSRDHWRICMQGHAAANMVPVVASNRTGTETIDGSTVTFYGSSFIADHNGRLLSHMDRTGEGVIVDTFDMDAIDIQRRAWGVFRDRRPESYGVLMTSDGCRSTSCH